MNTVKEVVDLIGSLIEQHEEIIDEEIKMATRLNTFPDRSILDYNRHAVTALKILRKKIQKG